MEETIEAQEPDTIQFRQQKQEICPEENIFPFCIVWTTLPIISWFFPFIGHTGIATSEGIIHDFAGHYTINIDDFAFGSPLKYVKLKVRIPSEGYDLAIKAADQKYSKMMHNLCCNNCHSHVASALNEMQYRNKTNWNMFDIWLMCLKEGKYLGNIHLAKTYLGFFLILLIVILIKIY